MLTLGVALVTAGRASALLLQGLALLLLAHALGLRDFGIFSLVLLVQGLVAVVSNLGVLGAGQFQAGLRDVQRVAAASLLATVASSALLIPPCALVLSWAYPTLLPDLPFGLFVIGLLAAPVRLAQEVILGVFVGMGDIRAQALLSLANPALLLGSLLVLALSGGISLDGAVIAWLGAQLGTLGLTLVQLRRHGQLHAPSAVAHDRAIWSAMLRLVPGAYFTYVVYWLVMRADRFALNLVGGPEAVGVLSLAGWVAESFALVSTAVGAVIFPRLRDEGFRGTHVRLATRSMIAVSVLLAVPTMLLFAIAAVVLDSPALRAAVSVLVILLPGYVLFSLFGILASFFWANAQTGMPALYYGGATLAKLAVVALIYPYAGILGVAFGLSAVSAISAVLGVWAVARSIGASTLDLLVPEASDVGRIVTTTRAIVRALPQGT